MKNFETLEIIVDEDHISYPTTQPWLETWYGTWLSVALPKLTAAGWQVLTTRTLVGLSKASTLYVLQRQIDAQQRHP